MRTLLAIYQKSREPGFWKLLDSFVLLAYVSLAASGILLQRLLACLNFPSAQKTHSNTNEKSDFHKLLQEHKQLKTMEMSEVLPNTYNDGYIHQCQPEPNHKIQ